MNNETREKRDYTVCFLRDLALSGFGQREEYLLRGRFGDGAFQVGGDVYGAVWAVYLLVMIRGRSERLTDSLSCEPA